MESMLHITTLHYLVLGAALFLLGVIGVLTRRNVVIVLMSIELILNAVNLNLVAFSRYWQGMPCPAMPAWADFRDFRHHRRRRRSRGRPRHPDRLLPQQGDGQH